MKSIGMDYYKRWLLPILLVLMLVIGYQINSDNEGEAPVIQKSEVDQLTMATIQNNSMIAISSPVLISPQVLADLSFDNIEIILDEIIKRESGGNPKICNLKYGCSSGMGLVGFIQKTWNSTLDRMTCSGIYDTQKCVLTYLPEKCNQKIVYPISKERTEAVFDGFCNRLVAKWLLDKDGIRHWDPYSGPYNLAELTK